MKCWLSITVVGLLLTVALTSSTTLSSYLNADDKAQLRNLFSTALPYKDASTAYWSLRGLSLLDALPKNTAQECSAIKSLAGDTPENIFCLTQASALAKCSHTYTADQQNILKSALAEQKVSSIYYAYMGLTSMNAKVDTKEVNTALENAMKTDDSPTSMGYAFLLAAALNVDIEKRYQLIEDVYAQADVFDKKYLQFDGGIYTTSLVVESSYKLAAAAKKVPTLKPDQVVQLANYLLSRRHVSKPRSAAQLLAGLKTLSTNAFQVPVSISLDKAGSFIGSANKKVAVRVGTVFGDSIGKVTLTADSARHIADDAIVLSKKQLTVTSDPSVFDLDFTNVKAPFGFYKVQLTAAPAKADSKLVGLKGSVEFKVVTNIKLDSVEIGVGDKDQSAVKTSKITYPSKAGQLDADTHQKLSMTFYIKSVESAASITAHQVFVRMTHKETGQEITFVSTAEESTKQYTFDLDVGAKEKEFGGLSGVYDVSLVVGDAIIENPLEWSVADLKLTFSGAPSTASSGDQYKPKPTIRHQFREPEKRPSPAVSNVFTVLCLSPLLVMFILWIRIGVNISNFPASLSAIGFHLGLAGIFFLYYLYWTQLNMFETVRYLAVLGIPTFLFGNQLLCAIASKRKAK